jgi:hypothetical protein
MADRFGSGPSETLALLALDFGAALTFGLGGTLGFAIPFFVLLGVDGRFRTKVVGGDGGGSESSEPLSLSAASSSKWTFAADFLLFVLDFALGRADSVVSWVGSSTFTSSPFLRRRLRSTILKLR